MLPSQKVIGWDVTFAQDGTTIGVWDLRACQMRMRKCFVPSAGGTSKRLKLTNLSIIIINMPIATLITVTLIIMYILM